MKFTRADATVAGWTLGFAASGREQLVVIAKATYRLPSEGEPAELAPEQLALVQEDLFSGEPGVSAPTHETDYAHRKPGCDVIVLGTAYAPHGQRVKRLPVGLKFGALVKRFDVVGNRVWTRGVLGATPSETEPFERMPVGYEHAFGGTDRTHEDRQQTNTFQANPVGKGFGKHAEHYMGQPLPNSEEPGRTVETPNGDYRPLAFGPIGRHWLPRLQYVGTYDQAWLENRAPLWPDDFDDRYFQCAPPDQVVAHPQGGKKSYC